MRAMSLSLPCVPVGFTAAAGAQQIECHAAGNWLILDAASSHRNWLKQRWSDDLSRTRCTAFIASTRSTQGRCV